MPGLEEIVTIELTKPLPETGVVDTTYRLEGTAKILENIGALPFVYAEVRLKEWYKPGAAEEVSYQCGFPIPISGDFSIDFKPEKEGDYEVTVLATPAPLSLPVVGVFPITGKSDVMKVAVGERPPAVFRFSAVTIDGHEVLLTDHGADSNLMLEKTTADYMDIVPAFEWTGPRKTATISVKAGYRDWAGGFSPKTAAYTRSITLPESPAIPYSGELESPIRIPLTACGGLADGAIEVVLKITGEPDYISHIWDVYATEAPPEEADIKDFDFKLTKDTYDVGARVPFTAPYDYKGIAQDGQLTISLGTGPIGTFLTKHTYSPVSVRFEEATDWETRGLEGSIVLPAILEPGQVYSVRAKLETLEIKTQETDTDWAAFDITIAPELELLEVKIDPAGAGYVTTNPEPSGGTEHNWLFPHGTIVYVTAHPHTGYTFKSWSGEMKDTTAITAPVYAMTEKRTITAHFEEAPPGKLPPEVDTLEATYITHDSAKLKGRLIDTGYYSTVYCYFEWGRTTSYGKTTPEVKMYEGDEGKTFYAEVQHYLEPDTTYHFRAAAITSGGELVGYGPDRSFTTLKEEIESFTMRTINCPAPAVEWKAAYPYLPYPRMKYAQPLNYRWEWDGRNGTELPDKEEEFSVFLFDTNGGIVRHDGRIERLRAGKNYVYDWSLPYLERMQEI